MTDPAENRLSELEGVLEQMLKPIKGIPFRVIVKSIAGCEVIPIDTGTTEDTVLLSGIEAAVHAAAAEVQRRPIERPRPNEVGNDIEGFVKEALLAQGFRVEPPAARNGLTKGVGYPDILIFDKAGRPTYIECKTYSAGTASTSMRSFYLSPSDNFKVCLDARHLVLSFEMIAEAVPGSRNSRYTATGFKLVDVADLPCDVKYEFNSDNRRLYGPALILSQGKL